MATAAPTRGLFRRMGLRKSVAQIQEETRTSELKRSLGPWNLVFLGIGCIIGAGIFVRTGNAAALHAGPAVLISYAIAGIICAFAGLCYAELASTLPVSGSAYTYSYATIGEFAAWVMGALLLLEYGLAASVVAVGWSGYVVSLLGDFGIVIPSYLTGPMGHHLQKDGVDVLVNGAPVVYLFNLPAFLVCSALAILLVIGVSESAKFNNAIVAIKVTVLVAFILVGGFIILKNLPAYLPNWDPFIPAPTGKDGEFGWSGILRAASIVFFAYIGLEAVSTAGQEAVDQHASGRRHRRFRGGLLRHQQPRRHDLGRHPRRLRGRLPVGDLASPDPSGNPARLPGAALSGRSDPRHRVLPVADHHRPDLRSDHLRLVHAGDDHPLFRLRDAQFAASQGPSGDRRRRAAHLPGRRADRRQRRAH